MTERDIFIAALQKEVPAQRQVYLDEACAHNPVLRKQVEDLLRLYEGAGSFLQNPAAESAATGDVGVRPTIDDPVTEGPGTVIGPYKLLQHIGEGGMGIVWMAEQTEPVKRKVALKVIKPGMDSRQVIARFEAERQALALMDHVNIARVFDGGTISINPKTQKPKTKQTQKHKSEIQNQGVSGLGASDLGFVCDLDFDACDLGSGRPYFVMELVHGVPITKYCDENRLTPRERLELFVPVCQAIQHAHQKGIIHRDIKPSNVMVTLYDGKPVPKVIDFGV
ncbi:MAG: serine/threonine protein kinase, partial [Gemmataceae bacterium]|nr:serine/threonine protein kinase [Gemmataceae bacterium]